MSRSELVRIFDPLALNGNHLVVHAAADALDSVETAELVATALMEAVGPGGTLVLPAFTDDTTCDGPTERPPGRRPVPFHSDLPVSELLGPLPEVFRRLPGVLRSSHPTHSFTAWGRRAREVLSTQRDNNTLGPLKKINVLQGNVLLLGAGLDAATILYLAEEGSGLPYLGRRTALRINLGGFEERVIVDNPPGCGAAFVRLDPFLDPARVRQIALPAGVARKIPARDLVTLASRMLAADPAYFVCGNPGCPACAHRREALGLAVA